MRRSPGRFVFEEKDFTSAETLFGKSVSTPSQKT
jgi:hypothetical protein